jgi:hypothetical protein
VTAALVAVLSALIAHAAFLYAAAVSLAVGFVFKCDIRKIIAATMCQPTACSQLYT